MIELVLALADKNTSRRLKEHIRKLPSSAFNDSREKNFFSSLLDSGDLLGSAQQAGYSPVEVAELYEGPEYQVFLNSDEKVQISKVSYLLEQDNKCKLTSQLRMLEQDVMLGREDTPAMLKRFNQSAAKLPTFKSDGSARTGIDSFIENAIANSTKDSKDLPKLPLPYRKMESDLGGLRYKEITLIAGETGTGKTLFSQNLVREWANMGKKILYVSLEMSDANLIDRWLKMEAYTKNMRITDEMLEAPTTIVEQEKLMDLGENIRRWDIDFSMSSTEIADIQFDMLRDEYDLIVVDHFHMVDGNDDLSKLRGLIKVFDTHAKENNCHVILLCQLKKEGTHGKSRVEKPHNGLILGGGALVQTASRVLFVWRSKNTESDCMEIWCTKDRHRGATDSMYLLKWIRNRFYLEDT